MECNRKPALQQFSFIWHKMHEDYLLKLRNKVLKSEWHRNKKFITGSKGNPIGLLITFNSKIFTSIQLSSPFKICKI